MRGCGRPACCPVCPRAIFLAVPACRAALLPPQLDRPVHGTTVRQGEPLPPAQVRDDLLGLAFRWPWGRSLFFRSSHWHGPPFPPHPARLDHPRANCSCLREQTAPALEFVGTCTSELFYLGFVPRLHLHDSDYKGSVSDMKGLRKLLS